MDELSQVEVAVSPIDKFREYLQARGLRLTQERATITEAVFSHHEHFDADQLVASLSERVSRSTIYRTLSMFEEAGLLRKVARTNDRDVYEHDYGYPQHDHLICKKCGSLTEFHNAQISSTLDEIARQHGFRMDGHRLEVYGTCSNCLRRPVRRHRKLDML